MRSRWIALIATTPPLRSDASAATTTSPAGANVTARSSATGGFSVASPSLEDLFVGLTGEGFDVDG